MLARRAGQIGNAVRGIRCLLTKNTAHASKNIDHLFVRAAVPMALADIYQTSSMVQLYLYAPMVLASEEITESPLVQKILHALLIQKKAPARPNYREIKKGILTFVRRSVKIHVSYQPIICKQLHQGRCLPSSQSKYKAIGRAITEQFGYNLWKENSKQVNEMKRILLIYKHPRKQVVNIEEIQPGDHVVIETFKSSKTNEQHGIIVSVHPEQGIFNMVKFLGAGDRTPNIVNAPHRFAEEGSVYVVEYREGECLPPSQVVRIASAMDGESVTYDESTRNSEHYASAIKTGTGVSELVETFSGFSGSSFKSSINTDVLLDGVRPEAVNCKCPKQKLVTG